MRPSTIAFLHVLILLEGCVYLGFSIWGLIMRQCSRAVTDFSDQPFLFTMDVLYLQDESCGNPNITYFAVREPVTLTPDWSVAETLKQRTHTFLIIYTVLSSFFIILSLVLLRILYITEYQRPIKLGVIGFWLFIVLAASCVDVVGVGLYGYDITQTGTAQAYLDYLGIQTDELTFVFLSSYDGDFVVPAAIATLICARGVILWLFNVIGSITCAIGMRSLSNNTAQPFLNANHNGEVLSSNDNNVVVIKEGNATTITTPDNHPQPNIYPVITVKQELY